MDCCKTWFAFLTADVIQRCVDHCEQECPGCKDGLLSPLLHLHNQYSLREKLDHYYNKIVIEMDISELFNRFILQFGWISLDQVEFISIGQYFVRFSTPEAIFYGKYITKDNDFALYGHISADDSTKSKDLKNPIKAKKRKKKNTSQDGVSGTSAEN